VLRQLSSSIRPSLTGRAANATIACHAPWLLVACGLVAAACKSDPEPAASNPAVSASAANPAPRASASTAVSAPSAPVAEAPHAPRNVLLLTIDSLRSDMPWAGYPRAIAPNLTKLAEQSVVYTNAYALSSYTAKSVAGFLTSRYPSTLYRSGFFFATYPKSDLFLAEVLKKHGVPTTAWHGHAYFRSAGFEQGFDTWQLVPGIEFNAETDESITSQAMTELGMKLLRKPENTGKQFFAWAHYMDPHDQYNKHPEASPEFGNKNRDRYDNEVFYTDLWLGKLLTWAREQQWWKDTVLIISADHGEAFGEHGSYKHAFEVWEVLTHVPFMISGPGIKPRRIEERRSHLDLAPTILDVMGFPPEPEFMGKSMLPELQGAAPDNREPILSELTEDSHNPLRRAFILGDYKLLVFDGRKYQLYNLSKDPSESTDLAESESGKLAEMKRAYNKLYDSLPLIEPYGGATLKGGATARGPLGPKQQ
jgi:choline-sulfatase